MNFCSKIIFLKIYFPGQTGRFNLTGFLKAPILDSSLGTELETALKDTSNPSEVVTNLTIILQNSVK